MIHQWIAVSKLPNKTQQPSKYPSISHYLCSCWTHHKHLRWNFLQQLLCLLLLLFIISNLFKNLYLFYQIRYTSLYRLRLWEILHKMSNLNLYVQKIYCIHNNDITMCIVYILTYMIYAVNCYNKYNNINFQLARSK